jgi:hypothetical protein
VPDRREGTERATAISRAFAFAPCAGGVCGTLSGHRRSARSLSLIADQVSRVAPSSSHPAAIGTGHSCTPRPAGPRPREMEIRILEISLAMLREDPARPGDQGCRRRVMDMINKVSPVPSREKPRLNSCERSPQAYHRPLRRNIPEPRQRREQHWLVYREGNQDWAVAAAARAFTLFSATAVSLLSAAFSSASVFSRTWATSLRPSRFAQEMRDP